MRLDEITENEEMLGSTEVTVSVKILATTVDDAAGNLNVSFNYALCPAP